MSFADVLAAANELTADERRELARELSDLPREEDPLIKRFLETFPPGVEIEMNWPIEASAENIAALRQVLAEADTRP